MVNVFAAPVFFIVFRETLETSIIVAILLVFLRKTFGPDAGDDVDPKRHTQLVRQVWIGTGVGLFITLVIGAGIIGAFYALEKNVFGDFEELWEGIFALIASIIITIVGAAMLRISKLQSKWRTKLALDDPARNITTLSKRYSMALLPFITVLREGLEAVVFVGGVSLSAPATAFPIPVITGLLAGSAVGFALYKGGVQLRSLQWFLVINTCVLYLVAAGLFSRAAWHFDMYQYAKLVGGDVAETGVGPGSYDITKTVWHVNCCSPVYNGGGGWGIFNALLGWQNSATYSSVICYNVYWIMVAVGFIFLRYKEKRSYIAGGIQSDEEKRSERKTDGKVMERACEGAK